MRLDQISNSMCDTSNVDTPSAHINAFGTDTAYDHADEYLAQKRFTDRANQLDLDETLANRLTVDRRAAHVLSHPELGDLADAAHLAGAPYRSSTGHSPRDQHGSRRPDRCHVTRHLHAAVHSYATADTASPDDHTEGLVLTHADPKTYSDHLPIVIDFHLPSPTRPVLIDSQESIA